MNNYRRKKKDYFLNQYNCQLFKKKKKKNKNNCKISIKFQIKKLKNILRDLPFLKSNNNNNKEMNNKIILHQ